MTLHPGVRQDYKPPFSGKRVRCQNCGKPQLLHPSNLCFGCRSLERLKVKILKIVELSPIPLRILEIEHKLCLEEKHVDTFDVRDIVCEFIHDGKLVFTPGRLVFWPGKPIPIPEKDKHVYVVDDGEYTYYIGESLVSVAIHHSQEYPPDEIASITELENHIVLEFRDEETGEFNEKTNKEIIAECKGKLPLAFAGSSW